MADRPLETDEILSLQGLLKKREEDTAALRKEFEESLNDNTAVKSDNAKERIGQLAGDAYESLKHLVKFAESENIKLSAAKYILDITIGKGRKEPDADEAMKELLKELTSDKAS